MVTDPNSPLYDDRVHEPFDEKLVRNIMHLGVHQSISVWVNTETGDPEVVAGRRRVKAAREANRRLVEQGSEPLRVKGTIQRGTPGKLTSVMISENEIRKEDSPLGRARKMQRMFDLGMSEDDVAIAFGCSSQTIRDGVMLLDATQAVQDAVENKEIGIGAAVSLSQQAPAVQREKIAEIKVINATETGHKRKEKIREVVASEEVKPVVRIRGKKEIDKAMARVEKAIQDVGVRTHLLALFNWMLGDEFVLDAICEAGEQAGADRALAEWEEEQRLEREAAEKPEVVHVEAQSPTNDESTDDESGDTDEESNTQQQTAAA